MKKGDLSIAALIEALSLNGPVTQSLNRRDKIMRRANNRDTAPRSGNLTRKQEERFWKLQKMKENGELDSGSDYGDEEEEEEKLQEESAYDEEEEDEEEEEEEEEEDEEEEQPRRRSPQNGKCDDDQTSFDDEEEEDGSTATDGSSEDVLMVGDEENDEFPGTEEPRVARQANHVRRSHIPLNDRLYSYIRRKLREAIDNMQNGQQLHQVLSADFMMLLDFLGLLEDQQEPFYDANDYNFADPPSMEHVRHWSNTRDSTQVPPQAIQWPPAAIAIFNHLFGETPEAMDTIDAWASDTALEEMEHLGMFEGNNVPADAHHHAMAPYTLINDYIQFLVLKGIDQSQRQTAGGNAPRPSNAPAQSQENKEEDNSFMTLDEGTSLRALLDAEKKKNAGQ